MIRKRIEERLTDIHAQWVASIEDEDVKILAERHSIITGGAIVSLLQGEEPKDYDIYFRYPETTLSIAKYYIDKYAPDNVSIENIDGRIKIVIPSSGHIKIPEEKKKKKEPIYHPVFMSSNAIMLSDKIQIIVRFYGEPAAIHDTFDYIHCCNYWDSCDKRLVLNPKALESIINKYLIYTGSRYPVCSLLRIRKFLKRGWTINAGQILKMCFQVSNLDLSDVKVLEDQLIGVDTAYFNELVERMKQDDVTTITQTYLINLIEEIFGC